MKDNTAPGPTASALRALAARIDAALPQTQCTRCGYPDCATYARAIAEGDAPINQCPPGGQEGVSRLANITGLPSLPLNPDHGYEGVRTVAFIDEAWCIGCTLCISACPTDAIVGANKLMHTVLEAYCTGCELCVPVCPVDCIQLENASGAATGWAAWSAGQAELARRRYEQRRARMPLIPTAPEPIPEPASPVAAAAAGETGTGGLPAPLANATAGTGASADAAAVRKAAIAAAMERARQRRAQAGGAN